MDNTKAYASWADTSRTLATIAVIFVHTSFPLVKKYNTIPLNDWWVGNFFDGLFRFCVPIFLMLTGALILPKTYKLDIFLKKRFHRILIPFIFWSFIYIFYYLSLRFQNGEYFTFKFIFKYIYSSLTNGSAYHLWYIYMLVGIYLFLPIISKWINNSSAIEVKYYATIWFIVAILNLPFLVKFKPQIELEYFAGYIGYTILGFIISTMPVSTKVKTFSFVLFIIGTSITVFGTYFITKQSGKFYDGLYSYLSPNVIIASAGFFLFIKQINIENKYALFVIKNISKYSYGIYLSHVLVLILISRIGFTYSLLNPIISIPLISIICLISAFTITYFLNKIPLGKYISG